MTIQIDGINTVNKGAELMLVSILEEIEKRYPQSIIYLNPNQELNMALLPKTSNTIKERWALRHSRIPIGILKRLKLPFSYFTHFHPIKGIDLILDASGFQYSDQWKYSLENLEQREYYYSKLSSYNTKIVFLPQAFGPFETESGKTSVNIIKNHVDLVIARDNISYNYLTELDFPTDKLLEYPDFTILTKGTLVENFKHIRNQVCIIPNKKMITHAEIGSNAYIEFLTRSIEFFQENDKNVFLLNHEGQGDLDLCVLLNEKLEYPLEIVTGLNAKQVKGVISESYVVISSRFHGVASSLSSGIPCLSTSWNHKYKMLYSDFKLENQVIHLKEGWEINKVKLQELLENREDIKGHLEQVKKDLVLKNKTMWDTIWAKIKMK